jgi:hypothetical protein
VSTLDDSFSALVGRLPTDAERQDLFRARDTLNIKNNDALWPLLVMLRHYETIYSAVPGLITQTVRDTVKRARSAAEAELRAASARIHADLARSVAETAAKIADRHANTKRWRWIAVSLAIATTGLTIVNILASRSGRAAGHADGYQAARDERAAESWANTPEGQLAYGLAKAGSIRVLATCSGRGWVVKEAYCFPRADTGSVYGWRLSPP